MKLKKGQKLYIDSYGDNPVCMTLSELKNYSLDYKGQTLYEVTVNRKVKVIVKEIPFELKEIK